MHKVFLANNEDLILLINDRNTNILCVNETWVPPEIRDENISIPNYVSYRCDAGRGGGVCMYVRDTFTIAPVSTDIVKPKGVEDVWVAVQSNKLLTVDVRCLYCHPKSLNDTFDYTEDVLDFISSKVSRFFSFR